MRRLSISRDNFLANESKIFNMLDGQVTSVSIANESKIYLRKDTKDCEKFRKNRIVVIFLTATFS